jgi:hypothetical protein
MATDAVPRSVALPERAAVPELPVPAPPLLTEVLTVDVSAPPLPIVPLAPVEVSPAPSVGRLLRVARATLGVLAHPYPRRAPRPPLTREEHLALAELELARLERERQAYRTGALGGSFR